MYNIFTLFKKEYTDKDARIWSIKREFGKYKVIIYDGVIAFGFMTFAFVMIINLLFLGKEEIEKHEFFINLFAFLFGGYIFGLLYWKQGQKAYNKYKEPDLNIKTNKTL